MLKKIALIVLAVFIISTIGVYADTSSTNNTNTAVEASGTTSIGTADNTGSAAAATPAAAGINPDSPLYALDKLVENIELFIIRDSVRQAELLSKFAQERLAESKAMMDENKVDLAQKALDDYKDMLDKAVNNLDSAMAAGKAVSQVADQLASSSVKDSEIVDTIINKTPDQYKDQVKQAIAKIVGSAEITHEVSDAVENKDDSTAKQQFEQGVIQSKVADQAAYDKMVQANLNLRQMVAVISLSEQTKKPIGDVLDMFLKNGGGIGETAQALGIAPKDALKGINSAFRQAKSDVKAAYKSALVQKQDSDKEAEDQNDKEDVKAADTVSGATAVTTAASGADSAREAKLQEKLKEAKTAIQDIKNQNGQAASKEDRKIEKEKAKLEKKIEKEKEKQERFEGKKGQGGDDRDKQDDDRGDEQEGSDD